MLLTIVIPTYNEYDNIGILLARLDNLLAPATGSYEIIVVDDASPDGTAAVVTGYAAQHTAVRLIRRIAPRDLSSALAEGFDNACGEYVLAMDADFQHPPECILTMLDVAQKSNVDLIVATRYAKGGDVVGWSGVRWMCSRMATRMSAFVLETTITDPLSGYFLLRRDLWQQVRPQLRPEGFKLLLDIIAVATGLRHAEVGYRFSGRQRGNSKMDAAVVKIFASSLLRLSWRRFMDSF